MRYLIVSRTLPINLVENKCRAAGGTSIRVMRAVKQVSCDLEPAAADKLAKEPGIKVSPVKLTRPGVRVLPPAAEVTGLQGFNPYDVYNDLRQLYRPPLRGEGLTAAVLDSGVRETHEALEGKLVYSANFTDSPTMRDVFGHGTGVAYLIAGEKGGKSGVAPGAKIMNIKILNDQGVGTDEQLVAGIEEVIERVEYATANYLELTDPMYPNTINLSIGTEDDGDPDNPIRVAVEAAVREYGIQVIAAAGNEGPDRSTILLPAASLDAVAVGGLRAAEFTIWPQSSRGPTVDGYIKPDLVAWAESIELASHRADDEYDVKSGTSFACPILVGVDGLLWDLTRRVYGPVARVTYYDWLPYAYAYTIKPEDAPLDKDNNYGYGIPAMGSMINRLQRPVTPVATIMETMVPMMLMMAFMPTLGAA